MKSIINMICIAGVLVGALWLLQTLGLRSDLLMSRSPMFAIAGAVIAGCSVVLLLWNNLARCQVR